jgi:hypothetical protein
MESIPEAEAGIGGVNAFHWFPGGPCMVRRALRLPATSLSTRLLILQSGLAI